MKPRQLAAAAALTCLAATAQAAVVLTFNTPALINFNPDGSQSLVEGDYTLAGDIGSFIPQPDPANSANGVLVGGSFGPGIPFSLGLTGGGAFSLLSLGDVFFDLQIGEIPGVLSITGLLNGASVATQTLNLGALSTFTFGSNFAGLTSVTFSGTSAFSIDNVAVAAVPEPASFALVALGLGALVLGARRARSAPK